MVLFIIVLLWCFVFQWCDYSLLAKLILQMNIIKVSNIMGFESKPFDPKTFVEEDVFVTDESGAKKRIRLEDNIVRWRRVRTRDGTMSVSDFFLWASFSFCLSYSKSFGYYFIFLNISLTYDSAIFCISQE